MNAPTPDLVSSIKSIASKPSTAFVALALFLVWHLTSSVDAKITSHAIEMREGNRDTVRLLIQICANTANTPEERAACWSVRP